MDEEKIDRLIEGLSRLTEVLHGQADGISRITEEERNALAEQEKINQKQKKEAWDALSEAEKIEVKRKAANTAAEKRFKDEAAWELKRYGIIKNQDGQFEKLADKRLGVEKAVTDGFLEVLKSNKELADKYGGATQAAAKAFQYDTKRSELYQSQLASMGRILEANGKITDSTIRLNKEQESTVRKIRAEDEARNKLTEAMAEAKSYLGSKGIVAGIGVAFDFLTAKIMGTYKGLIAYENALLDGVRGQSVQAAMVTEQMNAQAAVFEKVGGGMTSFGTSLATLGTQMVLMGGPIGLVAVAIGGLLAVLGMASEAEAAIIKRDAELNAKRAAAEDQAYKDFLQLGEASMTGARGVTGLIDDLKTVGLSIKEFDKLNKILSSNTKEIAMFGATTVNGAKTFIEVTGGLINSEMSKTFEKMGISQDAQMEHAEKYMAMQSRFGLLEGKSKQDLIKGTQNYIQELDRTAALTGATRKEQEQAREAVLALLNLAAATMNARLEGNKELAAQLEAGAKLATRYQQEGLTQQAKGIAELAASRALNGGKATALSGESAQTMSAMPEVVSLMDSGSKDDLKMFSIGVSELTKFSKPFLDAAIAGSDLSSLNLASISKLNEVSIRNEKMEKARQEFEANPRNIGKPFDEKAFIDAYRKAATDTRTTSDVDVFRKTQTEALDKQTKLLDGQLGAANQMKEAAGVMGGAAKTILDAGRKIYNAAFKGTKGEAENLGVSINKKSEEIENATARHKEAVEKIKKGDASKEALEAAELWNDRIKSLEKEKAVLVKQRDLTDDKAALEDKNKQAVTALQEKFDAQMARQGELNFAKQKAIADEYKDLEKRKAAGADVSKEMIAWNKKDRDNQIAMQASIRDLHKKQKAEKEAILVKQNSDLAKIQTNLDLAKSNKLPIAPTATVSSTQAGTMDSYVSRGTAPIKLPTADAAANKLPDAKARAEYATASPAERLEIEKTTGMTPSQLTAPKMAEGGIIPGTLGGTTVSVGEKGKPEAIIPLDALKGMLGGAGDENQRNATIIKFNSSINTLTDVTLKSLELTKESNKVVDLQTKETNKLILSMNKVTDMLPNTLAQIIAATGYTGGGAGGGAAGGGTTAIPQASTPGGTVKASSDMLRQSGLILKPGDTQKQDGEIDPRLIDIAKQVQASVPGFMQFTGFNDQFHSENTPGSKHSKGKAFDFVLNKPPTKDEGAKILAQLKSLGIDYAQDEYNDPSSAATGGHIHGQLNAYDGGVFDPKPGGVHVNLAEAGLREAAVPLNPGEKIKIEKPESGVARKEPLSTVLSEDTLSSGTKSDTAAQTLTELYDLMEAKFDSMISAIKDGNDISDKLLRYSQV